MADSPTQRNPLTWFDDDRDALIDEDRPVKDFRPHPSTMDAEEEVEIPVGDAEDVEQAGSDESLAPAKD